ncbi:MAG: calcium-binding protein, partial [Hyphomicrobiales bacterium]|nr:calcium-binding protein [Hyphomicrobiales bacterium]
AQAGGRYASVWFDGANGITKLQVINADGTLSGTPVSFAGIATPEIAGLDNGRFVIAAVSAGAQVVVQITENDGSPVSGPLELESSADFVDGVTITALANGRFVVAWRANDAGDSTIRGQLFNADGTLIGEEFLASTGIFARDPTITGLPDGRFFIAWEGVDSSSNGIRGQMFDPDGNKVGFEHIINATTEERQASVSVTTLADGRIAVVWDDSSNDDAVGDEIRGQILDPRTEPVSLRGGAEHDSLVGTFLADTLKGGRGPDLLLGENGNDVVHGGRGKDTIFGGGGNDLLRGGRGNDALDGGFGFDKSKGGRGDDTHVIDSTGDTVVERAGEGTDTVVSASVDLNLKTHDNVEDAKATGTADLSLKGSAGKNKLVGNAGDNRIKGLADADKLKGRDGDDTYLFAKVKHSKPSDPDTIIGFERDADVIHLGGIDAIAGGTDDPFAFIGKSGFSGSAGELRVARKGDDVKVSADVDGDGKADFATIVKDIQKLGEDDFVL